MVLSSIPTIAFTLLGGVIVDRYDVRRLMLGSETLRAIVTLAAAGLALLRPGIPLLAALALIEGTVDAIFQPAAGAIQPRLLQPEQYSGGATLTTVTGRLAMSLGGPLGGITVAFGGLPLGLLIDAATFAISVTTLCLVRPRPIPPDVSPTDSPTYIADFRAGFSFLIHHPVLRPLSAALLLVELGFVGPMNIGLAALSKEHGWGAHGIGLMLTGCGLGSGLGAILTHRMKIRKHIGVWIAVSAALMGAALFGSALATTLWAAVSAAAAVGFFGGPSNILGAVLIQTETPDELRGRVNSFQVLLTLSTVPLAMLGTGFATMAFGVRCTYAACAAIEGAALLTLFQSDFRRSRIAGG